MSNKQQLIINTESTQRNNYGLTFKESFCRPISAELNKNEFLRFSQTTKQATRNNDFSNILPLPNSYLNKGNIKTSISTSQKTFTNYYDNEKLYEENISLKEYINSLKKEIASLKFNLTKVERDLTKNGRTLDEIKIEMQGKTISSVDEGLISKIKGTSLISNLKRHVNDLQNEIKAKNDLINELKMNVKATKINELNYEIKTLNEEISKLMSFYQIALRKNSEMEKYAKEYSNIVQVVNNQNIEILKLSESNKKLENSKLSCEEDNGKLKLVLKEKEDRLLRCLRENKVFKESLEKSRKEETKKTDYTDVITYQKLQVLEKKVSEYKKDLNYYKELYEKRDKRVKELEALNLNKNAQFTQPQNNKIIQKHPEESYDSMILLLKSKLEEEKKNNKDLNQKLASYEKGMNEKLESIDVSNEKFLSEEEIQNFTYILIKNLEGKKVNSDEFKQIFNKDTNSKVLITNLSKTLFKLLNL